MAAKIRNMVEREGRYYSRLVIPKHLREAYGKTEDRIPLGGDYRTAVRLHHGAMYTLQQRLDLARKKAEAETGFKIQTPYRPLEDNQIAVRHYQARLKFDEELRNLDHRWAGGYIDDQLVQDLRNVIAGQATDDEIDALAGSWISRYQNLGYTKATKGTPQWRSLARALCAAELEALERVVERDEGDFTGLPKHPVIRDAELVPNGPEPVSLRFLFDKYIASRKLVGKGRETERRWTSVINSLVSFCGHDNANNISDDDIRKWKDHLLEAPQGNRKVPLSTKTVADVYLTGIRTVFNWAIENKLVKTNPAATVSQDVAVKQFSREKGFTKPEATRILAAALAYESSNIQGRIVENALTAAAKKWAPWLCAFSGARIAEVTQLRKEDFRMEGDVLVMRFRPDAGTIKSGSYRDVPVHPQLIALGFADFVERSSDGPLFFNNRSGRSPIKGARTVAGRISSWLRGAGLVPEGVDPNHGWRHRFKTVGREEEIASRVLDALAGHAAATTGDDYGDVTLKTKWAAIQKFPIYNVENQQPGATEEV